MPNTTTSGTADSTTLAVPGLPDGLTAHLAPLAGMDAVTWHGVSRLRQDVFIVEQDCAYPDQDGRDADPGTEHLWAAGPDGEVVATLRILHEDGGEARRIGRVATRVAWRGRRVMGALLRAAVARCGDLRIELEAQAHLQAWYERHGFTRIGDEFLEDGIPHVPMRRGAL